MRIARAKQLPPLVRLLPVLASVGALLAMAVLVAGCGSSDETSSTQGGTPQGESSTTKTSPEATTSTAPPGASVRHCSTSADTSELQVIGVSCSLARATASAWGRIHTCSSSKSSRYSCTIGQFRCQSAKTDRGFAVNCAGPGRSISFIAKR
jgi:hypothetical protein